MCRSIELVKEMPMYFVTMQRPGYALFSTTATERLAVGLTTDQKRLHLLIRAQDGWSVAREWPVDEYSHTDLMLALGKIDEPEDPASVLALVPALRSLH